jgi:hypothetical protein
MDDMRMARNLLVALLATLIPTVPANAQSSSLKSCGFGGVRANGLPAVNVHARAVTCRAARRVSRYARIAPTKGGIRSTRIDGVKWRCKTRQVATGTDPGFSAQTKVACRRPNRSKPFVKFALRS